MKTKQEGVRIAVGGQYLDKVEIRLPRDPGSSSISSLAYPAKRHTARVDADQVTIATPAPTVVQLFASDVLPPVGRGTIELEVGGQKLGAWTLSAVETAAVLSPDTILLRFIRPPPT